jgi:hypothetical protein
VTITTKIDSVKANSNWGAPVKAVIDNQEKFGGGQSQEAVGSVGLWVDVRLLRSMVALPVSDRLLRIFENYKNLREKQSNSIYPPRIGPNSTPALKAADRKLR